MTAIGLELIPEHWRNGGGDFVAAREIPGLGLCCVQRFAYSVALIVRADFGDSLTYDYERRYCYPRGNEATCALFVWDGESYDPPGEWIKEKLSGRSRIPRPGDDDHA